MVDFWSLTVLVFEVCCGSSPFYVEDTQQTYKNIAFGKVRSPKDALSTGGRNFVNGHVRRHFTGRQTVNMQTTSYKPWTNRKAHLLCRIWHDWLVLQRNTPQRPRRFESTRPQGLCHEVVPTPARYRVHGLQHVLSEDWRQCSPRTTSEERKKNLETEKMIRKDKKQQARQVKVRRANPRNSSLFSLELWLMRSDCRNSSISLTM